MSSPTHSYRGIQGDSKLDLALLEFGWSMERDIWGPFSLAKKIQIEVRTR